jgi:drug/metabolite transporter (DMT)-like permease
MPVVLAMCAAVCYGAGDFCGGRAARRASGVATTFVVLATGLALLFPLLFATWEGPPSARTWVFGALAGLGAASRP